MDLRRAERIALAASLVAVLALASACSSIPKGRSAIDSVTVRGNTEISDGEITDRLATAESPKFLGLFQGVVYDYSIYDESVLQRDLARVERYYRGRGFLDAHARAARVRQAGSSRVRISIVVDEGLPTLNREVRLEGLEDLPLQDAEAVRIAASEALPRGARFDEDAYKKGQAVVTSALTDRGYAYATVKAEARVDLGSHAIDYEFTVSPGIQAVFGSISFMGLDPDGNGPKPQVVDDKPLRRAIDIREGTKYSSSEIDLATRALLDLEIFSAVRIVPQLSDPPSRVVPLVVEVQPSKLREFRAGGGAEFDAIKTELHGLVGWEDHDFLGGLRDFTVELKPGVVPYPTRTTNVVWPTNYLPEERLRIQLRQPGFIEARTVGFVQPELNVYPLLVQTNPQPGSPVVGYVEPKTSVGLNRRFGKHWNATLAYNVQGEVPFAYTQKLDSNLKSVVLLFPQLITTLDFRDDAIHPHAGVYLANDFQVAGVPGTHLPSDLRIMPEARGYIPLTRDVTFALRGTLGFLFNPSYGSALGQDLYDVKRNDFMAVQNSIANQKGFGPALASDIQTLYFRGFFAGGPSSNRGYPVRGIAPYAIVPFLSPSSAGLLLRSCSQNGQVVLDQCVVPVGGFSLWQASAEVRFDISGPLGAAVFCDVGDVSPTAWDLRFDHLHMSCGAGARYDTPVGPIRLDIGYRIQPLQVLGYPGETAAAGGDPTNGAPPTIFGLPLGVAFGIGEAF